MAAGTKSPKKVVADLQDELNAKKEDLDKATSEHDEIAAKLKDLQKSLGDLQKTEDQFGKTVDDTKEAQETAGSYVDAMRQKFGRGPDKDLAEKVKKDLKDRVAAAVKDVDKDLKTKKDKLTNEQAGQQKDADALSAKQDALNAVEAELVRLGKLAAERKSAQEKLDGLKTQFEGLRAGGYDAAAWFVLDEMGQVLKSDACKWSKKDFQQKVEACWQAKLGAQDDLAKATDKEADGSKKVGEAKTALEEAGSNRQTAIIEKIKSSGPQQAETAEEQSPPG